MLITVGPENFGRWFSRAVDLVRTHRSGRITAEALAWLTGLAADDLGRPGTLIELTLSERRLVGVLACSDYGRDQCLIVIHRNYRGRGFGRKLVGGALRRLNELHARVAADNLPSLKVFFGAGLFAYDVFLRPNGKIILKLKTP